MDTIGSLVDKLSIVNLRMWNAQELFYKIRHMDFDKFKEEFGNDEGLKKLWKQFKTGIELNLNRNALIDEVDERLVELIQALINGEEVDGNFIQRKHKTY